MWKIIKTWIYTIAVIAIASLLCMCFTSCNKNEGPTKELTTCMEMTGGEWTDSDCEYCKWLLTDENRTISRKWQYEQGEYIFWAVEFTDGERADQLSDYELEQVEIHSVGVDPAYKPVNTLPPSSSALENMVFL